MAAMQAGLDPAYNIPARPRIGPEYPAMTLFPAGIRVRRQTPSAEPRLRSLQSDPYAPTEQPVVREMLRKRRWAVWSDPNTPSSSETSADDAYRRFHAPESSWLADALAELAEVDDEIAEEELPPVDEPTKTEAERIIRALTRRHLLAPTIYPTPDAEIAIHFKSPDRPDAVLILLNNSGQADCHVYIGGRGRRSHYNTSLDLPDAFVLDQLRRLTPPGRTAVSTPNTGFLQFGTAFLTTNLLQTR